MDELRELFATPLNGARTSGDDARAFPGDVALATGLVAKLNAGEVTRLRTARTPAKVRYRLNVIAKRLGGGYEPDSVYAAAQWLAALGDDALIEMRDRLAAGGPDARGATLERGLDWLASLAGDRQALIEWLMLGAVACWRHEYQVEQGLARVHTGARFGELCVHAVHEVEHETGTRRLVSAVVGVTGSQWVSMGWEPEDEWIGDERARVLAGAVADALEAYPALAEPSAAARLGWHRRPPGPIYNQWVPVTVPVCASDKELWAALGDRDVPAAQGSRWLLALAATHAGETMTQALWPIDGRRHEVHIFGDGDDDYIAIARPLGGSDDEAGIPMMCLVSRPPAPEPLGPDPDHGAVLMSFVDGLVARIPGLTGGDVCAELTTRLVDSGQLPNTNPPPKLELRGLVSLALSGAIVQTTVDGGGLLATLPDDGGDIVVTPSGLTRALRTARKFGYVLPTRASGGGSPPVAW